MSLLGLSGAGRALAAAAVFAFLSLAASVATAQDWSNGGPPGQDWVTGYQCADSTCAFLRTPIGNCVCQRLNPGEMRADRVEVKCSTKEGGQWVACPVPSGLIDRNR